MADNLKHNLKKGIDQLFLLNRQNDFDQIILSNFEKILKICEITIKENLPDKNCSYIGDL